MALADVYGAALAHWWFEDYSSGTWADDVGSADATQATANRRPDATTTPGGRTVLDFDVDSGEEDSLETGGGHAPPVGTAAMQIAGLIFIPESLSLSDTPMATMSSMDSIVARMGRSSGKQFAFYDTGGNHVVQSSEGLSVGWHTFVLDCGSFGARLYVDGELDGTSADFAVTFSSIDHFLFGWGASLFGIKFNGQIGSVAIAYSSTDFEEDTVAQAAHAYLLTLLQPPPLTLTVTPASLVLTGQQATLTVSGGGGGGGGGVGPPPRLSLGLGLGL